MVGKHVRFLEERLGVRLIHRTTRRQSLTEFGQAYYSLPRGACRGGSRRRARDRSTVRAARAAAGDHAGVAGPALRWRRCCSSWRRNIRRSSSILSFGDPVADLMEGGYDRAIRTGDLNGQSGAIRAAHRAPAHDGVRFARLSRRPTASRGRSMSSASTRRWSTRRSGRLRPWLFPRNGQPPRSPASRPATNSTISKPSPTLRRAAWGWRGCHPGWCANASTTARWSAFSATKRIALRLPCAAGCRRRAYRLKVRLAVGCTRSRAAEARGVVSSLCACGMPS